MREGSKKDKAQDKKLMKKYGYKTMKQWEKSKEDKAHDEEKLTKRIRRATSGKQKKRYPMAKTGQNANPAYRVTY